MKIFPYKRVRVAERLYVRLSQHFRHSDFGVRDSGDFRYSGCRYVCPGDPGTGFVERESESHSYRQFVRSQVARQQPSYWKMLTGREPSYDRALEKARQALAATTDSAKREVLDCYVNALGVGKSEEYLERVVRGIKDKIGHHSSKFLVSVLSHYKNKIAQLGHDMKSVEYRVKEHCTAEQYEAYTAMVEAFTKLASCRRVWQYVPERRDKYVQVQFDLGIFDFIRVDSYMPIMRDAEGRHIYLLPDSVIVARSNYDFDMVPLRSVNIVSQELAIEEPVEVLTSRLGDAASMIRIPELGLTYYFNHLRPVMAFVHAVDKLKATL